MNVGTDFDRVLEAFGAVFSVFFWQKVGASRRSREPARTLCGRANQVRFARVLSPRVPGEVDEEAEPEQARLALRRGVLRELQDEGVRGGAALLRQPGPDLPSVSVEAHNTRAP